MVAFASPIAVTDFLLLSLIACLLEEDEEDRRIPPTSRIFMPVSVMPESGYSACLGTSSVVTYLAPP